MSETRRVVEAYFTAWTNKDTEAAYACLHPELEFIGPSARCTSAAEFKPGLERFAAVTKAARLTHLVVDGGMAAMLYDCELIAPSAVAFRIASVFRVEGGKIRWYETCFDPTEFRKVMMASTGIAPKPS